MFHIGQLNLSIIRLFHVVASTVKTDDFDSQLNADNYVYDNLVRIVDIFPIFALMRTSNQYYWSENLIDLQKEIDKDDTEKKQVETLLSLLSETELKTLKMVSNHLTSKEISDNLFVTTKSVENYRSRICKKIGLESGHNSLLVWALSYKEIIDQY